MNNQILAKSYQSVSIETATPGKLILMLFDGALKFINFSLQAFDEKSSSKRNETINNNLINAQKIIAELQACLNEKTGGEIATHLHRLYDFMYNQLQQGNLEKDPNPIKIAQSALVDIRDAWEEMLSKQPSLEKACPQTA